MEKRPTFNRSFGNAFVEASVIIEANVSIGPGAVVLQGNAERATTVRAGANIGANATVLGGLELGPGCVVNPGSVVDCDVPARVIVAGNPARIVGYASTVLGERQRPSLASHTNTHTTLAGGLLLSNGARQIALPTVQDLRGSLSVGEVHKEVPFAPQRYFVVFGVPSAEVRGEHAHLRCHQFLVCVAGHCSAIVDDGSERHEVHLNHKGVGLYMPPLTWGVQYKYSRDAVLLVLASHAYDTADYIRDYDEFCEIVSKGSQK